MMEHGGSTVGDFLSRTWPFSELPEAQREAVRERLRERRIEPGELLFREGDAADALHVIREGQFEVFSERDGGTPMRHARLEAGDCLGEMALALPGAGGHARVRSASVRAVSRGLVLELQSADFHEIFAREPRFRALLVRLAEDRLSDLRGHFEAFFGELPTETLARLQASLERIPLLAGEVLFRQGDPADGIFIVETGRVQVLVAHEGVERAVAELGHGQVVGEGALLTREPRSATIRAVRDSWLLRLADEAFERVVREHPSTALAMARTLARRLAQATHRVTAPRGATVVCLLAAQDGPGLHALAEALGAQIRGSVVALDRPRSESAQSSDLATGDTTHLRVGGWLADLESRHDVVLLLANAEITPWGRFCLRQSDRVVLVARAAGSPALTPLEEELKAGRLPGRSAVDRLVLVHPPGMSKKLAERARFRRHKSCTAWRSSPSVTPAPPGEAPGSMP